MVKAITSTYSAEANVNEVDVKARKRRAGAKLAPETIEKDRWPQAVGCTVRTLAENGAHGRILQMTGVKSGGY